MEKNSKISSPIINKEIFFPKYIKYPFYGVASNLIDKFIVLGYEQKIIEQNFQNGEAENTEKEGFKFFNFKERPSIINELCNDFKKECQDNDTILSLIFPDFPKLYFLEKKEQKDQKERLANYEEIQTYSIIFSLNPQDNDGAKKSFNCLGYIFYIKKEHRNNNNFFFIPKIMMVLKNLLIAWDIFFISKKSTEIIITKLMDGFFILMHMLFYLIILIFTILIKFVKIFISK